MKIILCGSDAVFKTTIANKLSKKLELPIEKGSDFQSATGTNEDLFNFFLSKIDGKDKILDRYIYSNLAYTNVYPEYTRITDEQKSYIENKIRNNSIIIYLTASVDTIISRIEERGDEYVTTDKIEPIIKSYNQVISDAVDNNMNVYTFDTSVLTSDKITQQILELIIPLGKDVHSSCANCDKNISKDNSYFHHTHCFDCYLKIMEEISN